MAGTRSSARLANASSSQSSAKTDKASPRAGSKRKATSQDSSPPKGSRGKKAAKQTTIEDTMPELEKPENDQPQDIEMQEAADVGEGTDRPIEGADDVKKGESTNGQHQNGNAEEFNEQEHDPDQDDAADGAAKEGDEEEASGGAEDEAEPDTQQSKASEAKAKHDEDELPADQKPEATSTESGKHSAAGAVKESSERSDQMPSNILEKGVIYFFTRGRVGIEQPESVQELQRTYMVLRPIPKGGKLGEGAIGDTNVARLIALPKKVFPKSGRDRFMVFVEKAGVSMKQLKEDFFQGSEYETKTMGTRQTPPVTPLGEGVYALTMDGRTSHLAYMLTIPKQLGEVQNDMGIREQGSFVTSLKNPTAPAPAYANLPEGPEYPEEMIKEFGGRRFIPIHKVEFLDYANAQFLLIGASPEKFSEALKKTEEDEKNDNEGPQEELEKLEEEDQMRVEALKGDDSIFEDLGISKKEYPDVATTW